jgi:hypothetical protein
MKTTHTSSNKANRRLICILGGVAMLMFTFLTLQLTIGSGVDSQGFNWKPLDFFIAGLLLFSTGISIELVLRSVQSFKKRLLICATTLLILLLIWAELAVGIFASPFAGS